jgi:predicted KAP-like P-loop ATPase
MTKSYAADAPVKNQAEDRFRRWPFAKRIAETVVARPDPSSIVVGIYGAWGEGKTSVLNFIESELLSHESVVCVRFNPWRFKDETTLLLNYFGTLADALGRTISSKKEKIGKWFQEYGTLLAPLSLSFFGLGFSPGQATAETGKILSSIDLEELRNRIEGLLVEEKKRIVVLMDDIDRLDKNEIHAIFRLVKLSADFSYIAYILAFDDYMVSAALQERYATGVEESGQSFLEKIVQVPLRLPPADQISLRQFCFEGVDEAIKISEVTLTEEQVQSFVRYFVDGIENRLKTPRMCKRYANALTFALPILAGEVNSVDLMLIEGIRVFYPSLYTFIRRNRELFAGTLSDSAFDRTKEKESAVQAIDQAIGQFQNDDATNIRELLKTLFPRLSGLYGNVHYGTDWEKTWAEEQRVASKEYFDRYFSYAIPEGDVPDREIENLLETCKGGDIEATVVKMKDLLTSRNAEKVIKKLRYREKSLNPFISRTLGEAVALSGETFPHPEVLFSFMTPFSQASILIAQLAKNILQKDRLKYAEKVLSIAVPLPFAVECLRWFRTGEEKDDSEKLFTSAVEDKLGKLVAGRIASIAKETTIYMEYGGDAPIILWAWSHWDRKQTTEAHVRQALEAKPETVTELLRTYIPTAWGMESGLPIKGDFKREQYDSLSKTLDPDIVYDSIERLYGKQFLDTFDPATIDGKSFEEKVALQFLQVHRHVKTELTEDTKDTVESQNHLNEENTSEKSQQ